MNPVYIAGPYAADTPEGGVAANVRRACVLSRYALSRELAPLCVHPGVALGAFGDDGIPTDRARGLSASCALAATVAANPKGRLWAITRGDGSPSEGTAREIEAFKLRRAVRMQFGSVEWLSEHEAITVRPWAAWIEAFVAAGFNFPGGL